MRDLQKDGGSANGTAAARVDLTELDTDLGLPEAPPVSARAARRDQRLAETAVLMIDTAKYLEPVVAMLSGKLLRWAVVGGAFGLSFYALAAFFRADPPWEGAAAVCGTYAFVLLVLAWRLGRD